VFSSEADTGSHEENASRQKDQSLGSDSIRTGQALAWNNRAATEIVAAMDQKGPVTDTPAQQLENREQRRDEKQIAAHRLK
jgi:hypothetical protein